jgi:amidase
MRPSRGRISLEGVMPLAPRFVTVGWFARDPALSVAGGGDTLSALAHAGALKQPSSDSRKAPPAIAT